ncbi:uncharacterized protein LOC144096656 isoform X2 [Amblyomma americanum]
MKFTFVLASLLFINTSNVCGKLGAPGGPRKLHFDAPDSFKVFDTFKFAVAISDSDNDTIFECMSANRTAIDPVEKTATYVFMFPNTGQEIPFHVKAGDIPGTITFTVDGECALWARRSVKDNVPQNCIDHFVDICGVIVPEHSRDLCRDGEGDYK